MTKNNLRIVSEDRAMNAGKLCQSTKEAGVVALRVGYQATQRSLPGAYAYKRCVFSRFMSWHCKFW